MTRPRNPWTALAVLLSFLLGALANWWATRPEPAPVATPRPAVVLPGGAVAAERRDAREALPVKPETPPRTRLTDTTTATLKPKAPGCPEVKLTCSVVEEEDGNRRVVLDADGATVEEAKHWQVTPGAAKPAPLRWYVGALGVYDYDDQRWTYGAKVARSFGALTVGAGATSEVVQVEVGWRF